MIPFGAFVSGIELPGGRIPTLTPSFSVPDQLAVASLTVLQNRPKCITNKNWGTQRSEALK
jgi:hypothetical protein